MNEPRPELRETSPWGRGHWVVVLLGALLLGGALFLCELSRRESFVYESAFAKRPISTLVGVLGAMGAVYFIVALLALRRAPPLGWVIVFGVLFRAVLLPTQPLQEDDLYRYVWDGKVVAEGIDPYLVTPLELQRFPEAQPEGEDARFRRQLLLRLSRLRARSEANGVILDRVNNAQYPTIYPPILQFVFSIHGRMVPADWSVESQLVAMKCLLGLFDLGILALLPLLLRLARLPPGLTVLYAWCPLVLKECANSGHLDAVPAFFVMAALTMALAVAYSKDASSAVSWAIGSGVALGLAISSKFYALVLVLPLWRRLGFVRGGVAVFACANVVGIQLGLFPAGAENRNGIVQLFALKWENHCAVFTAVREVLEWLVGERWVEVSYGAGVESISLSAIWARVVVGSFVGLAVLWNAWKIRPSGQPREFLERCFFVIAILLLAGPLGFPWYFVWCIPLLPFVRRRAWFLLPGILAFYYLGFWFEYRYDESRESWWLIFDPIVFTEFLFFFVALGYEGIVEVVNEKSWRK